MFISIIIPAYNEEKNIKATVEDIYSYLSVRYPDHEIIVTTDGSLDRTDDIVMELAKSIPTLKLVKQEKNHGKGHAVKKAMLQATGQVRLFTDADNSTTIDHLEKMLPFLNQGYDIVIGSIALKGHKIAAGSEPLWRRLAGKMGNLFIQIMAVPGIHDTQRGFKIFSARAAHEIFSRLTIERFGFDVEALALARKFGYKIKEVPIRWKNDPNSHVGLKSYFQVLWETTKVRWNLLTGVYK